MAEETVWTGTPSQIKNLGAYLLCIVILPIIGIICVGYKLPSWFLLLDLVVLAYAFWKWLLVKTREYRLTAERLLVTEGVLSKCTESLELYRVKDFRITQPLLQRLFGLETIELISSDQDTPDLVIDHIPQNLQISSKIRQYVETCRTQKSTREVELE